MYTSCLGIMGNFWDGGVDTDSEITAALQPRPVALPAIFLCLSVSPLDAWRDKWDNTSQKFLLSSVRDHFVPKLPRTWY